MAPSLDVEGKRLVRSLLRWTLRAGAWGLALALALGWLGALHPALDSFAHLRLHLLALALVALPVLLAASRRRSALALTVTGLVSLALTWPFLPGGEPGVARAGAPARSLRVAQLNMRFNNPRLDLLEQTLRDTGADVLLLQEVSRNTMQVLERLTDYPHRHVCRFRDFRGVAVVSRRPFAAALPCAADGGLAIVRLRDPAITMVSLHTYWPWPARQWQQLRSVKGVLRGLEPPLIMAGDFNAVPWSAAVGFVEEATGTRAVPGLRFTFNTLRLQSGNTRRGGLPIDHVLLSPDVALGKIRLMPHSGSDHLGTAFEVTLP